jgi:hypothetical protein
VPWWHYDDETTTTDIRGDEAVRAAAQFLPYLNRKGASARVVKEAVALAAGSDSPKGSFSDAAHLAARRESRNVFDKGRLFRDARFGHRASLTKVPAEIRLALEMISHEDSERRALEGELHVLEDAWKEAEEIAAIADDMFLPEEISKRLAEMKGR